MPKTQRSHQDAVNHIKIWNYTKSNKITLRRKSLAKWRKSYQDAVNHTKISNDTKRNKISLKRKLYPKRRKIIPRIGWLHQGVKLHQDKQNPPKTKISFKTEKKSYQDSRDHHKVMTSDITWPHIRIISLKVIKSLQGKESHINTQKLDQDIKFTPRRTWPPWSNDVIRPTGWPCGRMLWSAHMALANEQGLWISLSYQNSHHQIIISGFIYLENRFALQDWITEFKFIFQIWHGLQPFFNNIIDPNQENCANTLGCVGSYK